MSPHTWPSLTLFFPFCLLSLPVLGLVPALVHILRPTETTPAGTIRTTEVGSGGTTEATGGRTITEGEAEATTHEVITRTEEEVVVAMATRPTGRVVVEAGMTATMTRTTTHTAPGGGAHAPAHPRSIRVVAAVPATLTARLRVTLDAPGVPAILLGPGPRPHIIAAARASLAPRMLKKS